MSYFNDDTIVAPATSLSRPAALAVLRISGLNAKSLANRILAKPLAKANMLFRTEIRDEAGACVDEAMACFFKGPKSFTGEDSLELYLHGSPFLVHTVQELIVNTGLARPAEPGEFSFRAFTNGKIDLAQAEAISDLIHSSTKSAARASLSVLQGQVGRFVEQLKADLVHLLAGLEVEIDFSDQGVPTLDFAGWVQDAESWLQKVRLARQEFKKSLPLREGIETALVGDPNSGKSTLFNAILGQDRSIISEIAGTTRDVVSEQVYLGDLLLKISDTAGIRETSQAIESEGIKRSIGAMEKSHLVLVVLGADRSHEELLSLSRSFLAQINKSNPDAEAILVLNKVDLLDPSAKEALVNELVKQGKPVFPVSAIQAEGLDSLASIISDLFRHSNSQKPDVYLTRMRHFEVLGRAEQYLEAALIKIRGGEKMLDLLSSDLRAALDCLNELVGADSAEDVLNYIFSEFCIGK